MRPLSLLLLGLPRPTLPPIARWIAVTRERRRLAALDDRTLRDIGITREQALHEATQPFWRLPDR